MKALHYVVESLWEETFLDRWQAGSQGVPQVSAGGVGEVQVGGWAAGRCFSGKCSSSVLYELC